MWVFRLLPPCSRELVSFTFAEPRLGSVPTEPRVQRQTHQQAGNGGAAVGWHDDQLGTDLLRELGNLAGRVAEGDFDFNRFVFRIAEPFSNGLL